MRVYGEILYPLSNLNEIGTRVGLKSTNDQGKFELDRARNRNNIAENSFALGHETDNVDIVGVSSSSYFELKLT